MTDKHPKAPEAGGNAKESAILAKEICQNLIASIEKQPDDHSRHMQLLEDSRHALVREAAKIVNFGKWQEKGANTQEFLWNLAIRIPEYNLDALYKKRASLLALGGAIALGWFLGGLVSSFMGLLSLGGEILRPAAIFLLIWLEEYVSINPKARKWFLTILGFGGLARFATMAMGGFFRFTGFGSLRQAIFGVARPNIFKLFWFMLGGLFIVVFFSRKVIGLDTLAFKQSLLTQLEQRALCVFYVLDAIEKQNEKIARLNFDLDESEKNRPKEQCHQLARAVTGILPALDENTRKFLRSSLAESGFEVQGNDEDTFIWNSKIHEPLYTSIGLIHDGDKAKILQEPYTANGKTIKGHAQKVQD